MSATNKTNASERFAILALARAQKIVLVMVMLAFGAVSSHAAVTITPTSWNVVGLDSNNPAVGPDTYQIGARICNTGGTAVTSLVGTFVWDTSNSLINLSGANPINVSSLGGGACVDMYFPVTITRTSSAYNTTRGYHISVSGTGFATVSTPTPRELYVEKIISQNRNSVNSIAGPTTVYVGNTYQYTVNASTATQGYEQLEAFLNLSNVIFQVQSIATTYTSPAGATNDKFYADACGWDNNPLSGTYRSCIGPANYAGGKAGGTISTTYTVKILSTGTTTASTLINDFSGSSYHYNNDYGIGINSITITAMNPPVPNVGLQKSVSPTAAAQTIPRADLTYTITFTNSGTAAASSLVITDPIPNNTDFKVGSPTSSLGTTGLTVIVAYSNNAGSTYSYTPVSGGGGAPSGYDRFVTNIRWTFSGNLSQSSPNNSGSIAFTTRIQ
ncbi:MAG TPA: hypothetical protein VE863_07785 [Pyrinomonadaceae bacterium]|jgi:uncharacterized repeat protein (TIGR01451 family)|nr:hypothetical protein [Pyrinomonadaceae bacterium]